MMVSLEPYLDQYRQWVDTMHTPHGGELFPAWWQAKLINVAHIVLALLAMTALLAAVWFMEQGLMSAISACRGQSSSSDYYSSSEYYGWCFLKAGISVCAAITLFFAGVPKWHTSTPQPTQTVANYVEQQAGVSHMACKRLPKTPIDTYDPKNLLDLTGYYPCTVTLQDGAAVNATLNIRGNQFSLTQTSNGKLLTKGA